MRNTVLTTFFSISTYKKIIKACPFLICTCLFLVNGYSQTANNDSIFSDNIVIPPLPNAASLGTFGDIPVNHSTGVPDISIPLFTLSGGMEPGLPISISYHTGNLKADQPTGNLGIGWALNAGGTISRTVYGLPDETSYGYVYSFDQYDFETNCADFGVSIPYDSLMPDFVPSRHLIPYFNEDDFGNLTFTYSSSEIRGVPNPLHEQLVEAAEKYRDLEPDIFTINLPNETTAIFAFDKNKNIHFLSQTDIKIETNLFDDPMNPSNVFWKVRTGDGTMYEFSGVNEASNISIINESGTITPTPYDHFPSSWHLTKIYSPAQKEVFTFLYEDDPIDDYDLLQSQTEHLKRIDVNFPRCDCYGKTHTILVRKQITGKRIYSITNNLNNSVVFGYDEEEERQDLSGNHRMKNIEIYNSGQLFKKFEFFHSYNNRLKLDSIIESDANGKKLPPYKFDYDAQQFPVFPCYSIDHWGFYNANNNYDLIPNYTRIINNPSPFPHWTKTLLIDEKTDNNRKPDATTSKAGTIERITYPTGGSISFDYESHTYRIDDFQVIRKTGAWINGNRSAVIASNFYFDASKLPANYTYKSMPDYGLVYLYIDLSCNNTNSQGIIDDLCFHFVELKNLDSDETFTLTADGDTYDQSQPVKLMIPSGNYQVSAGNMTYPDREGSKAYIRIEWDEVNPLSPVKEKIAGGVRIKKITKDFLTGSPETTHFEYINPDENNNPSGRLLHQPFYHSFPYTNCYLTDGDAHKAVREQYEAISSNSLFRGGGSHIFYADVIVREGNSTGKTHYRYSFERDWIDLGKFEFARPVNKSAYRGKLTLKELFNASGAPIKKIQYFYSNKYERRIPFINTQVFAIKSFWNPYYSYPRGRLDPNITSVKYIQSYFLSSFSSLDSTIVTDYFKSVEVIKKYRFDYNNKNFQVKEEKQSLSTNKWLKKKTYYPVDYDDGVGYSSSLKYRNIISIPVKEEQFVDGRQTGGAIRIYNSYGKLIKGYVKEENMGSSEVAHDPANILSNPDYKLKIEKTYYPGSLLLQEMGKTDDYRTTILYGYKNNLPIAKIENATYAEVEAALGTQNISALSSSYDSASINTEIQTLRDALPGAMVATYTYAPITGMTSQTDPAGRKTGYEYDSFGRLKYIRDHKDNILKKHKYIYRTPPPKDLIINGGGIFCGGTHSFRRSTPPAGITYYWQTNAYGTDMSNFNSSYGYYTTGTHTIYLRAYNTVAECWSSSTNATITVNPLPTIYNVTGGGSYCTGENGIEVALSGSETGVTYHLKRGGTAITSVDGTGAAISFGYQTTEGTYTVEAINNTTSSCSSSMNGNATITATPSPTIYNVTGGGSYCTGENGIEVALSGSETGVTYHLRRGGAAIISVDGTGAAISFGYQTTEGTYTVEAINNTTSCSSSMNGNATITATPSPTIYNVTGGGSYCTGENGIEVALSGSETGVTYHLKRGGTAITSVDGTGAAISFGYQTTEGTYTVEAINNTTSSCSSSMNGNATITATPSPTIYNVTGGGSYCTGENGIEVALSGSETGVTYQLKRGGAAITSVNGTGAAISFGYQTTEGTYTVEAINNTSSSCSSSMNGNATITATPSPTIYNVTGGGSYCTGENGIEVALSGSETGVTYHLKRGGTAIISVDGTGAAISFGYQTTEGTYTVEAINNANSCSSSMNGNATVTVNPLPTAYDVTGGGTYCPGGSGIEIGLSGSETGVTYHLKRGGTAITSVTGTGAAISFGYQTTEGTYTVEATNNKTSCNRNMNDSATITEAYIIAASAGTGGSISPEGNVNVDPGSYQSFTITADLNYKIADVIVDGTSKGAINQYSFRSVTENHTISATFTFDFCYPCEYDSSCDCCVDEFGNSMGCIQFDISGNYSNQPIIFSTQIGAVQPDGVITTKSTNQTNTNIIYTWDFGDGEAASGKTIDHEYKKAGTYTVTLAITNTQGETKEYTKEIIIEDEP